MSFASRPEFAVSNGALVFPIISSPSLSFLSLFFSPHFSSLFFLTYAHTSFATVRPMSGDAHLAIACGKNIQILEVASGKCMQTLEGHSSYVNAVSWSSDGERICSGSYDNTVRVWEVSSGKCLQTLEDTLVM